MYEKLYREAIYAATKVVSETVSPLETTEERASAALAALLTSGATLADMCGMKASDFAQMAFAAHESASRK